MELKNGIIISEEQQEILTGLETGNVIVDAVAGSGKTTTNLFIAKKFKNLKILLLTYNSKLKIETRVKVEQHNITNMEVHTYHSFCCKYYDPECYTDYKILTMMEFWDYQSSGLIECDYECDSDDDSDNDCSIFVHESTDKESKSDSTNKINYNPVSKIKIFDYDIIILDEAQDITELYYKLNHKIISDNDNVKLKLCLLGDKKQNIYGYAGSDHRYMQYGRKLFNVNKYPWIDVNLSVSFRVTIPIAGFLNECMLDYKRINTTKLGKKVRYVICNQYTGNKKQDYANHIYEEIRYYLNIRNKDETRKYSPSDIFILAPSIKSRYISQLVNKLSFNGIKIFISNADDDSVTDDKILNNKIIFLSLHQSKGLERPIVIILNFDESYFEFYNKTASRKTCPNTLYVAITRSSERLSVMHHYNKPYMTYLNINKLNKYAEVIVKKKFSVKIAKLRAYDNKFNGLSVTRLVEHLSAYGIKNSLDYITYKPVTVKADNYGEICILSKIKQDENTYESVSDITGTAIPAYYEYLTTGEMNMFNILKKLNNPSNDPLNISTKYTRFRNLNNLFSSKLLELSLEWITHRSNMIHRKNQIKDFNWLHKSTVEKCVSRLRRFIGKNAKYECQVTAKGYEELQGENIRGYIDCIDANKIWEFKCTSRIKEIHIIQMAIYIYLLNKTGKNDPSNEFYIFNILSGKIITIQNDKRELEKMVEYLIELNNNKNSKLSDKKFITKALAAVLPLSCR